MYKSAMKGLELNGMDAIRSRIDDVLSEGCSCKKEDKWRCVVLNFFKELRLNASEVDRIIARSKMIDDHPQDSKSELCDMFTLLKGLELHGGAPTKKPPTTWQEVDARGPYDPRLAAWSLLDEVKFSRCPRVSVEGYNILLPVDRLERELRTHFLGCGEICDVVIPFNPRTYRTSDRCSVIYFWEEGAAEKALALSGTEVGLLYGIDVPGWDVIVKPLPKKVCEISTDQVTAALEDLHFQDSRLAIFLVTGYDTRLPEDDVKSALFKLFSSCGEITALDVCKDFPSTNRLRSTCTVCIWGDGALEKAKALSGSYVGGWKAVILSDEFVGSIGWSGPPRHVRWDGTEIYKPNRDNKLMDAILAAESARPIGWSGPPLHVRESIKPWDGTENYKPKREREKLMAAIMAAESVGPIGWSGPPLHVRKSIKPWDGTVNYKPKRQKLMAPAIAAAATAEFVRPIG